MPEISFDWRATPQGGLQDTPQSGGSVTEGLSGPAGSVRSGDIDVLSATTTHAVGNPSSRFGVARPSARRRRESRPFGCRDVGRRGTNGPARERTMRFERPMRWTYARP